jgi:hypothetical protein
MSLFAAWTEVNTAVAVGICSGLGFAVVGIYTRLTAAALAAEKARLDIVVAEYADSNKRCEERCGRLEIEIRALQQEFREGWKARYEPRKPGSESSPPTSG